jgi:hypothetical protein
MTLDEFADMTQTVIAKDGLAGFQPTGCWPARRQIRVLAGVPDGVDVEAASLKWALGLCQDGEEVLIAFASGPAAFTVIRQVGTEREVRIYEVPAA